VEAIEERSFVAALIWMTAKRGCAAGRVAEADAWLRAGSQKRGRLTQRTAEKGQRSRRGLGGILIRGGACDWMMRPACWSAAARRTPTVLLDA
jgi:hypothetical protein